MKKIISFLIPFLPLAIYYNLILTSISLSSFLISIIFVLFVLIYLNRKCKCSYLLIIIFSYIFIQTIVLFALKGSFSIFQFIITSFVLLMVAFYGNGKKRNLFLDYSTLYKTYIFLVRVSVIYYLMQVLLSFIGIALPNCFFFLPFNEGYSNINPYYNLSSVVFGRASSFFSEPSHFCVFLLPAIEIYIIKWSKRKKIVYLIPILFISLIIVSTVSGNGILSLAVLALANVLIKPYDVGRNNILKKLLSILLLCSFIYLAYILLNKIEFFNDMFSRLFTPGEFTVSKAGYRIYRGFVLFSMLPFTNKLFGIGFSQLTNFVISNSITTIYDYGSSNFEYANFVAQFIIYFGIICGVLLLLYYSILFRNISKFGRCFLIAFFALCFSCSMLFESTFLFLTTMVFLIGDRNESDWYETKKLNRIRLRTH